MDGMGCDDMYLPPPVETDRGGEMQGPWVGCGQLHDEMGKVGWDEMEFF